MYTMEQWKTDGTLKVRQGQMVSDEVVNELANCVPPTTYSRGLFQIGEPYDHDEYGCALYGTFERKKYGWLFLGNCREGEIIPRMGICEKMMLEYEQNKQL